MKINAEITYNESYLPTKRHRIPRLREVEETVEVELREVPKTDAKLAMVVTDYQSYLDKEGVDHFGPVDTELFAIGHDLYAKKKDMAGALDKGDYPLSRLVADIREYGVHRIWCANDADRTKDYVLQELEKFVDAHLVMDGEVYLRSEEPRYVVNTFGLGHNHGGTAMFIEYGYNGNINKNNYFNALQREEAIAYANQVAAARGDTDDIGKFGDNRNIVVFMPELIRCNPQLEHGDGSSFLNSLENLIQASSSPLEAGLFVMAETAAGIQGAKKPSLAEQLQTASSRADERRPASDVKMKEPEPEER